MPADVFQYNPWWLGPNPDSLKSYAIQRFWAHGKKLSVLLEGVSDRTRAESFKGIKIWIPASEIDQGDDEYMWEDLSGCQVFADGDCLGKVVALEDFGAQDILVIDSIEGSRQQGQWRLPFVKEVVGDVSLDEQRIEVHLPEGMDVCFTPRS